jgi:hypothetical protein
MRPVPASNPALLLLTDYVGLLRTNHEFSSLELQRAFVKHVYDLVALTLGGDP